MKKETRKTLLAILIAFIVIFGGYLGVRMWEATTIIVDSTPPEIDEEKTTHGDMAYMSPFTVKCIVCENIEMDKVTAELSWYTGFPYPTLQVLETITLNLISQDGDVYTYAGSFSTAMQKDRTYYVTYVAYDKAGWEDRFRATICLVNVEGYVVINGKQVGQDDVIRLRTRELDIRVYITVGQDSVDEVYGTISGEPLTFTWQTPFMQQAYWGATYTLPEDGTYELIVYVRDTAGVESRFASFTITVGQQYKWEMILIVVFILAVICIIGYYSRTEKARAGKKKR